MSNGGHLHIYLVTDDIEATANRLRGLGVTIERDVHDTDWQTREFVITDDQGHTIYFGQNV